MTPHTLMPPLATTAHSTTNGHAASAGWVAPASAAVYVGLLNDIAAAAGLGLQLPQVIGLTSCGRREGVSTVAENLAGVAARSLEANVLFIDSHLAAPALDKLPNFSRGKGLTDFLSCECELLECIHEGECERLSYLPVGGKPAKNPLSQQNLTALFEQARKNFDLIVVDLPPVAEWNDCVSFARHVDGVLLVVAKERVRTEVARQAMRVLRQAEIDLLGVVLNDPE